jgi:hypothetical protein
MYVKLNENSDEKTHIYTVGMVLDYKKVTESV